jgi:hypothetical protein
MDDLYLGLGLTGMATAGEPFMAHFGAALLAGWWLDRDVGFSQSTSEAMARQADALVGKHAWLFSDHQRASGSDCSDEIIEAIEPGLEHVWAIGHDVIYAALVLRTLRERPELGTAPVIEGVLRLLSSCREQPLETIGGVFDVRDAKGEEVADDEVADVTSLAKLALTTILDVQHVYIGLHQGDIGHVADHAHALLVLDRLGYRDASRRGTAGFRQHVAALRRVRYLTADLGEVRHGLDADPRQILYWNQASSENDWAIGHVFKYPYALLDLLDIAGEEDLTTPVLRRLGELVCSA